MKEIYLYIGVLVGAIMWASVNSLIENNNLLSIIGLAFSCLVMGISMGQFTKGESK